MVKCDLTRFGSVMVLILAALGAAGQAPQVTSGAAEEEATPEAQPVDIDPNVAQVQSLGLRQRVAQLMLVTLGGRAGPNAEDRLLLEHYTPGGVVIPTMVSPNDAAMYIKDLRAFELSTGIPLWIGTNMFTLGRGERDARSEFLQLPSLLSLAAVNDAEAVEFVAGVVGDYLATMGFNLHMGPCLELPPVLAGAHGSVQSLGSGLEFVGAAGCTFLGVLAKHGVMAMPMGFPGGGANRLPKAPAALLTPRPLLAEGDLKPFARVIEHGAEILHVGNTLTPTLDTTNAPACLSRSVLSGLLRDELGFTGVIVAGPLDAPHIGAMYDFPEAAIQALNAGADMLYWNMPGRRVIRVADEIVKAVEAGDLREAVINGALRRVLTLKRQYGIREREAPKEKEADKLTRNREYPRESARLERHSITLVKNRDRTLPLSKEMSLPLGITGVIGVRELNDILVKRLKAVRMQPIDTARHLGEIQDFEIHRVTSRLGAMRTVVCTLSDGLRAAGLIEMIHELKQEGARVVVVLLGYPDNLHNLAEADAIVLGYCHRSAYAMTVHGVADVLLGRGPIAIDPGEGDIQMNAGQTEKFNVLDIVRCPAGRLPVSLAEPYPAGLAVSCDPTDAIKKVEWDFGDGKRKKDFRARHAYKEPGRYPVKVTVTDATGDVVSRTFHVVVQ